VLFEVVLDDDGLAQFALEVLVPVVNELQQCFDFVIFLTKIFVIGVVGQHLLLGILLVLLLASCPDQSNQLLGFSRL
jgi:hypothetical protein